jgi:hypothetical protein
VRGAASLVPRAGWVGLAAAAGVATGYGIEQAYPEYSAHSANIGGRVAAATGSDVAGITATVVTTLPLIWVGTKIYDRLRK